MSTINGNLKTPDKPGFLNNAILGWFIL